MSGRLLVAYDNGSAYVPTVAEYLDSLSLHSRWQVRYLHVTHGASIAFDLNEFDAVFHNYCARFDVAGHVGADYLRALKSFRGVKLLAVQDEYDRPDMLQAAIRELGFHIVLTCVPQSMLGRVFPPALFPQTQFITVLTGYVPEDLARRGETAPPLAARPIHIGYRGRDIGGRYGRLGFLKLEIGRRMRAICEARGIPHDIEWSADKRIYGEAWYEFLASCRATLGSESASNVFDFGGSIAETYQRLSAERGHPVAWEEFRRYTDPVETQYDMAQISPRVFEAAALRTPMILLSGRYSGIIEPETHYIELKEDFSNVDSVLARLDDLDGLERMAERAYRDLVASGGYGYRRFVALVDDALDRKAAELALSLRPAPPDFARARSDSDPAVLEGLDEWPTQKRRHFVFYDYKRIAHDNALLRSEIVRLNEAIGETRPWRRMRQIVHARAVHAVLGLRTPVPADLPFGRRLLRRAARRLAASLPASARAELKRLLISPKPSRNRPLGR